MIKNTKKSFVLQNRKQKKKLKITKEIRIPFGLFPKLTPFYLSGFPFDLGSV